MYKTQQRMRRFSHDYPVLYAMFTAFIVTFMIAICFFLFYGPVELAYVFKCGWFMLLELVTIPSCVGLIIHICRIYGF